MRVISSKWVLATMVAIATGVSAQEWPTGSVKIMVGSAPGGGADTVARLMASKLNTPLRQSIVVDNKPGATGTLAADFVAKSTDQHTLLLATAGTQVIVPHMRKLPYDHTKDFAPVAMLAAVPHVLVVPNSLPAKSVGELIALAKAKPAGLNYASSGQGSAQQVAAELFQEATGTKIVHVPYKGSSQALVDLMAGQVQMNFDTLSSAMPYIKRGQVRALAVMAAKRSPQLPDVPTMAEAGVKNVEMSAWYGIYAPRNIPKQAQETLHRELSKIVQMPDVSAQLEAVGVEPMPVSQGQFVEFLRKEDARFAALITQRGIKMD